MSTTRVVNLRSGEPYDVRIDRRTKWGNPFHIGPDGDRNMVILKYRMYIASRNDLIDALPELKGKTLACWCKPASCHGDVLAELAEAQP